jgi:hypothetical protein
MKTGIRDGKSDIGNLFVVISLILWLIGVGVLLHFAK